MKSRYYPFGILSFWILRYKIPLFLFVFIFFYLFVLNIFLPPQADDIYASIQAKEGLHSAINSYMTWNARIGEMLFLSFVGGWSDLVFDFVNALIGSIFIYMFFAFIFARFPEARDIYCIFLIVFCLLYFAPFGADFLWGSGSLNYMWGILLMMVALLPYRIFWNDIVADKHCQVRFMVSWKLATMFIVISFLAGMASEQLGIIIILCHICFVSYAICRRIRLGVWYVLGIIAFVLGYACLYFSPGLAARASMSILEGRFLDIGELLALPFSQKIDRFLLLLDYSMTSIFKAFILVLLLISAKVNMPNRSLRILYLLFVWLIAFFIAFNNNGLFLHMVAIVLLFSVLKYHRICKVIFALYGIYLLLCLSGVQMLIFPPRARLGDILVMISIFCILYQYIKDSRLINAVICVFCIIYGAFVANEYYKFYQRWNDMLVYVENEKQKGNYDVVVENIFISRYPNFIDSPLPTDIAVESPNPLYAYKFGLKSFRVDDYYKEIK